MIEFPKQTFSPYKQIYDLIDAANRLIKYHDDGLIFDDDKFALFAALIHIERAADAYRGLIPPGSSAEFSGEKSDVNTQLDNLRAKIWNIGDSLEKNATRDALNCAGEDFKSRFIN